MHATEAPPNPCIHCAGLGALIAVNESHSACAAGARSSARRTTLQSSQPADGPESGPASQPEFTFGAQPMKGSASTPGRLAESEAAAKTDKVEQEPPGGGGR